MDEFILKGLWWEPSDPTIKYMGVMTFSPYIGIRLKVDGLLHRKGVIFSGSLERAELIIGTSLDGEQITLWHCQETFFDPPEQEWMPTIGYIGAHFHSSSEILFHKALVQYNRLSEWVGYSKAAGEQIEGKSRYEVSYEYPSELSVPISQGALSIINEFEIGHTNSDGISVKRSVAFSLNLGSEVNYGTLHRELIHPLQGWLSFATDSPNYITNVRVWSDKALVLSDQAVQKGILVLFSRRPRIEENSDSSLWPRETLFSFPEIRADFPSCINRWFEIFEELQAIVDLYLGVQDSLFGVQQFSPMHIQQQFLSIVQAVESYHRYRASKFTSVLLPENEHSQIITLLLEHMDSIAPEHRAWLTDLLNYSNEPRLRTRLNDLVGHAGNVITKLMKKSGLVHRTTQTRNNLTHPSPDRKEALVEGIELYRLTRILYVLLQYCLLIEIGLSPDRARKYMTNMRSYMILEQWNT